MIFKEIDDLYMTILLKNALNAAINLGNNSSLTIETLEFRIEYVHCIEKNSGRNY